MSINVKQFVENSQKARNMKDYRLTVGEYDYRVNFEENVNKTFVKLRVDRRAVGKKNFTFFQSVIVNLVGRPVDEQIRDAIDKVSSVEE